MQLDMYVCVHVTCFKVPCWQCTLTFEVYFTSTEKVLVVIYVFVVGTYVDRAMSAAIMNYKVRVYFINSLFTLVIDNKHVLYNIAA